MPVNEQIGLTLLVCVYITAAVFLVLDDLIGLRPRWAAFVWPLAFVLLFFRWLWVNRESWTRFWTEVD